MVLRQLYIFFSYSAGTVFRRQILTSKDGPRGSEGEIAGTYLSWSVLFDVLVASRSPFRVGLLSSSHPGGFLE